LHPEKKLNNSYLRSIGGIVARVIPTTTLQSASHTHYFQGKSRVMPTTFRPKRESYPLPPRVVPTTCASHTYYFASRALWISGRARVIPTTLRELYPLPARVIPTTSGEPYPLLAVANGQTLVDCGLLGFTGSLVCGFLLADKFGCCRYHVFPIARRFNFFVAG